MGFGRINEIDRQEINLGLQDRFTRKDLETMLAINDLKLKFRRKFEIWAAEQFRKRRLAHERRNGYQTSNPKELDKEIRKIYPDPNCPAYLDHHHRLLRENDEGMIPFDQNPSLPDYQYDRLSPSEFDKIYFPLIEEISAKTGASFDQIFADLAKALGYFNQFYDRTHTISNFFSIKQYDFYDQLNRRNSSPGQFLKYYLAYGRSCALAIAKHQAAVMDYHSNDGGGEWMTKDREIEASFGKMYKLVPPKYHDQFFAVFCKLSGMNADLAYMMRATKVVRELVENGREDCLSIFFDFLEVGPNYSFRNEHHYASFFSLDEIYNERDGTYLEIKPDPDPTREKNPRGHDVWAAFPAMAQAKVFANEIDCFRTATPEILREHLLKYFKMLLDEDHFFGPALTLREIELSEDLYEKYLEECYPRIPAVYRKTRHYGTISLPEKIRTNWQGLSTDELITVLQFPITHQDLGNQALNIAENWKAIKKNYPDGPEALALRLKKITQAPNVQNALRHYAIGRLTRSLSRKKAIRRIEYAEKIAITHGPAADEIMNFTDKLTYEVKQSKQPVDEKKLLSGLDCLTALFINLDDKTFPGLAETIVKLACPFLFDKNFDQLIRGLKIIVETITKEIPSSDKKIHLSYHHLRNVIENYLAAILIHGGKRSKDGFELLILSCIEKLPKKVPFEDHARIISALIKKFGLEDQYLSNTIWQYAKAIELGLDYKLAGALVRHVTDYYQEHVEGSFGITRNKPMFNLELLHTPGLSPDLPAPELNNLQNSVAAIELILKSVPDHPCFFTENINSLDIPADIILKKIQKSVLTVRAALEKILDPKIAEEEYMISVYHKLDYLLDALFKREKISLDSREFLTVDVKGLALVQMKIRQLIGEIQEITSPILNDMSYNYYHGEGQKDLAAEQMMALTDYEIVRRNLAALHKIETTSPFGHPGMFDELRQQVDRLERIGVVRLAMHGRKFQLPDSTLLQRDSSEMTKTVLAGTAFLAAIGVFHHPELQGKIQPLPLGNDVKALIGQQTDQEIAPSEAAENIFRRYKDLVIGNIAEALPVVERMILNARSQMPGTLFIGGKVHTKISIQEGLFSELQNSFGFNSTPFHLIHANDSVVMPPFPTPLEMSLFLRLVGQFGLWDGKSPDLQAAIAGRWPENVASIVGSAMLLGSLAKVEYSNSSFKTAEHDKQTGAKIMAYDAGVKQPNLPFDIAKANGRTDILGRHEFTDLTMYQALGTTATHFVYGGRWAGLYRNFENSFRKIIAKYQLQNALQLSRCIYSP